jgi:ornithine decarboxylase
MNMQVAGLSPALAERVTFHDAGGITRDVRPDDPVYLFSEACLARRCRRFRSGFPGQVSYAVKANPEPRVIRTLAAGGVTHFDVASIGEVETMAALQPGATLHFNNPVKAEDAVERAYRQFNVRSYALDELSELEKIRRATRRSPEILYSVRFRLPHGAASYDFGSKFGATPDAAIDMLRRIAGFGARAALIFHPGSQCTDPGVYYRYLQTAADVVRRAGVRVEQINVGGGFPEYYENTSAPALEQYFDAVERASSDCFEAAPLLMCEPGRAMVASSISLLTRVIHVRQDDGAVFLNDGVYGGMQEQALVDIRFPVRAWRQGQLLAGERNCRRVFGPTCDPVDRLSGEISLPRGLQTGDYLEFGLLGAYGSATSTAFNGFRSSRYFNVECGFGITVPAE